MWRICATTRGIIAANFPTMRELVFWRFRDIFVYLVVYLVLYSFVAFDYSSYLFFISFISFHLNY
jgi:hypothetical protein